MSVPDLVRTLELADLVAYAGATWDWHRLHYDREWVEAAGLPAPLVDGQELGALMAEQALDHLGLLATVVALEFRLTAPVYAGETVRVRGRLEEGACSGTVVLRQSVTVGDRRCAVGSTTVRLRPARDGGPGGG